MNIIFLDIDGVLAPHPESQKKKNVDSFGYPLDEYCVYNLNELIKHTNSSIVLTGSVRMQLQTRNFAEEYLINRGIDGSKLMPYGHYKTNNNNDGKRGFQIQDYLVHNNPQNYCILEDEMFDMLYIHRHNIVECDSKIGFGEREYFQALKILTK